MHTAAAAALPVLPVRLSTTTIGAARRGLPSFPTLHRHPGFVQEERAVTKISLQDLQKSTRDHHHDCHGHHHKRHPWRSVLPWFKFKGTFGAQEG